MEQTKTKKKSKSFIVLLLAILLCIAVVLGMGGFTYAKYISSKSAETQTASVAKWGYVISADSTDLFGTKYDSNGAVIKSTDTSTPIGVAASASSSLIVAPGTSGSMTFSIKGSAEVRSKITIDATNGGTVTLTWNETTTNDSGDETTTSKTYEPIKWTLTDNNASESDNPIVDGGSFDDLVSALEDLSKADIAPNNPDDEGNSSDVDLSYTISWEWAFESGNDEYDTILGACMATDTTGVTTSNEDVITVSTSDGTTTATVNNVEYTATTSVSFGLKITVEQIQGTAESEEEPSEGESN